MDVSFDQRASSIVVDVEADRNDTKQIRRTKERGLEGSCTIP
jgi:hypothetical protein